MRDSLLIYSPMIPMMLLFLPKNRPSYWLMERPRPKDQSLFEPRGGAGQKSSCSDAFQGKSKKAQRQRMLQGAAVHRIILRRMLNGEVVLGCFGAQGLRSSSGILEPSETLKKNVFQSAIKIQE